VQITLYCIFSHAAQIQGHDLELRNGKMWLYTNCTGSMHFSCRWELFRNPHLSYFSKNRFFETPPFPKIISFDRLELNCKFLYFTDNSQKFTKSLSSWPKHCKHWQTSLALERLTFIQTIHFSEGC
jgi:hypothetical protein